MRMSGRVADDARTCLATFADGSVAPTRLDWKTHPPLGLDGVDYVKLAIAMMPKQPLT
jgi:hypothetical protein